MGVDQDGVENLGLNAGGLIRKEAKRYIDMALSPASVLGCMHKETITGCRALTMEQTMIQTRPLFFM